MKTPNKFKTPVIKCPHCGYEYLPGEIYVPGSLTGQPCDIVRDALGKIIYEDYTEPKKPELIEHYECDGCGRPFIVEAVITYKSRTEAPETDFTSEYVSLLD
jgi:DNA-directed RNA polymerase subunit RPC12/RpoP